MDTRVFTYIETDDSEANGYHFEWHGGTIVNVVSDAVNEDIDVFSFMDQPTVEQVVKACEEYFRS